MRWTGSPVAAGVSQIILIGALAILTSGTAHAAYPADPLADGNAAFCAPKEPVEDFGLLGLPPVRKVPESGEELGHGAVDIYGGWERVMPGPGGFGYGFSEHNYGGTVLLNWTVTAELWTIDKQGNAYQEVDREDLLIHRLDAAHQPHIEVEPPKGRRGFYRFDVQISNQAGEVLGSYGAYFKVVRPFWKVTLGLALDTLRPGQRVFGRLENFGTERVSYGEAFRVQRLEGGRWVNQPELTPDHWLAWLGGLPPGGTGLCNSFVLPTDASSGRYRVQKSVGPGRGAKKRAVLAAPFTVTG